MQLYNLKTSAAGKPLFPVPMVILMSLVHSSPASWSETESNHYVNSVGMKMVLIGEGTFQMGMARPRVDGWNEQPVHKVTISRPFYICDREVTIEQFQQFRPNVSGSRTADPFITGVSWYDAMAFCEWLSKKEGKPYRLPTEAEWEYAARAGTDTPFWLGDEPPEPGATNPWGLRNVHWRASEWCYDWYGPYSPLPQVDPVGPAGGLAKVIRGGGLDELDTYYARSRSRAAYAPAFTERIEKEPEIPTEQILADATLEGLVGLIYGNEKMDRVDGMAIITSLNQSWDRSRGNDWSAQWWGVLLAPVTGDVTFQVAADFGVVIKLDNEKIIDWMGGPAEHSAIVNLERDKKYLLEATFFHYGGEKCFIDAKWSWVGQPKSPIAKANLLHSPQQKRSVQRIADRTIVPHPAIGFRVVQATLPQTRPLSKTKPFVRQCVVQNQPMLRQAPNPDRPWFRRRGVNANKSVGIGYS